MEAVQAVLTGERVLLIGETDTIYDETMRRIITTPSYSAYVKIAEGCSNCCSFCVIPLVRGSYRSRPAASVVSEVRKLAEQGVKEINLIAQDSTSYGRDQYDQPQLIGLLKELVKIDGIAWIRLLYCYPRYFNDELIDFIASEPKICKYIDLPLQHAHDDILRAMNRYDTRAEIETLLSKMRTRIPGVVIRTSFIVGFPGETESHFESLKQFVLEQKLERVGVFTYSQEEDTPAGSMEDQVPDDVKEERYHELMALQCQISEELNRDLEGRRLNVLIEGYNPEQPEVAYGRSYREAPDVDGRIYVEDAGDVSVGEMVETEVVQGFTYDLLVQRK